MGTATVGTAPQNESNGCPRAGRCSSCSRAAHDSEQNALVWRDLGWIRTSTSALARFEFWLKWHLVSIYGRPVGMGCDGH